jgi:phosphatidylserine/phosphatidylglycerophosphate/cardiolipin synthase-like enzyme
VARVLDALSPLAALLAQARDPIAAAEALARGADAGADAATLLAQLQAAVVDTGLAATVLTYAGVLDANGRLTGAAATRLAQAAVLVEATQDAERRQDRWQLVLTVPGFLRDALEASVAEHGDAMRPIETTRAVLEVAAAAHSRLLLAAPFLHEQFVRQLIPAVERVLSTSGEVVVITRALSFAAPDRSSANMAAVDGLRAAAAHVTAGRLVVRSWEESGLGIHFKVVLADARLAYLGSANPTPAGTAGHAEAGVLLHGPGVAGLARWLDAVCLELAHRRLPHA